MTLSAGILQTDSGMVPRWMGANGRLAVQLTTVVLSKVFILVAGTMETGEVSGPTWKPNPVARHVACRVEPNVPTSCKLQGYDTEASSRNASRPMEYWVKVLPKEGFLYETSMNYRTDGSDPKHMPESLGPHLLPFKLSDPLNRLIYIPPYNVWHPEVMWSSFEYEVKVFPERKPGDTTEPEPEISESGLAVFTNPYGAIAGSNFDLSLNGWSITGNLAGEEVLAGGLKHQAFVWGGLSRYVYV